MITGLWLRPSSPSRPGPGGLHGPFIDDPLATIGDWRDQLTALVTEHAAAVSATALAFSAALVTARAWVVRWRHRRLVTGARVVEVLPPPTSDLAGAEALWTHLLGLLRPSWLRPITGTPHVGWEMVFTSAGVRFRLWVPGSVPPGLVERAVAGAWPGAQTRTAPAGTHVIGLGQRARGGLMVLARPDHYPIRSDFDADPLRTMLATGGGLAHGETVIVQVLARPVTGRRLRRAARYATALRYGTSPTLASSFLDLLSPGHRPAPAHRRTTPLNAETPAEVRAILHKAARPRFEVDLCYLTATANMTAHGRRWLRGQSHAVASTFAAFTDHNHLRRRRLPRPATTLGTRRMRRGGLLSVPELAAICHLPLDQAVLGLARAPAKPTPPPPNIPTGGSDARILGDSEAGEPRPIGLRIADSRQHTHLLGGTGTGKTTALLNMQLEDARAGHGFVSIESKGDSTLILSRLPESCIGRTVVIDPDDQARPPCLNILDGPNAELTADTVVGIFRRIYADFWGPRTDDILRAAILTACARPGATLADVPELLENDTYRRAHTLQITNPFLRHFWTWYDGLSPAHRAQVTGPVMNKLRAVLLRGFARDVLAAGPSTVDLTHLLNTGGILIARLPKGVLGEDTARMLGSMILAKVWQTVQARANVPEQLRVDCTIYVDECHNFLTLPHGIDDILAEARSHRAGLVLAHQNLAQLPRELREAISANARNKLYFNISPEDAGQLERHVHPALSAHDLTHLDTFQAAARLVHNGGLAPPFTLRTRPLAPPTRGREKAIRQASRAAYGAKKLPPAPTAAPISSDLDPR